MNPNDQKITATAPPEDFVGRAAEIEVLRRHARGAANGGGDDAACALLVPSAPRVGASEILKQLYDRLFFEQTEIIPIYFAVSAADRTAEICAARFARTFAAQAVAFRRRDPQIIDRAPDACELAELAGAPDEKWVESLLADCRAKNVDGAAFVRRCLSAPLRAAAMNARVFLIVDELHETDFFGGAADFVEEIKAIFSRSRQPFVVAGRRRFLSKRLLTGAGRLSEAKTLPVEPLAFADAQILIEKTAARRAVEINEPTRDLIAVKSRGEPVFVEFLLQAARARQARLDSFRSVERVYADEIFGGRTAQVYDAILNKIAPDAATQKAVVELFDPARAAENRRISVEEWTKNLDADAASARRAIELLNCEEIIRLSSNRIEPMTENETLRDYLTARFRLEITGENRAAALGEMLSHFIKRAPQTMARFYRQTAAIDLRELLAGFDGQTVPRRLLDYGIYKNHSEQPEESENSATDEAEKIRLPQTVFAAPAAAVYSPFERIIERTRAAIARGFVEGVYNVADETVWLAAEIDSKLEASAETTEFWCDRLEMLAANCNFPKYKLWLVAPEGFASEALEILETRGGYGSSRRQTELLREFLGAADAGAPAVEKTAAVEYEIVVPMGGDSELIAAATVEEVARRFDFPAKAINQMKTAVVEACINAVEHSHSPERKIRQKLTVEKDRIVITIANRGVRLLDRESDETNALGAGRRGWGLKLMKTLMDEVIVEPTDDGTRISLTKYRK